MLAIAGKSVFRHVVEGFSSLFSTEDFLFVLPDDTRIAAFVKNECDAIGLVDPSLAVLDGPTRGQAETVEQGLARAAVDGESPLSIFNIDTIRTGFDYPLNLDLGAVDGYLEVFEGDGDGWSFVRPARENSGRVAETAEKQRISNLCCTGFYHFRTARHFTDTFTDALNDPDWPLVNGEYYVAPLYNRLIVGGADIRYHLIRKSEVSSCGSPDQYEAMRRQMEYDDG
ncbi:MAG: capsular biosynthesis protein [Pseudomonadota bacterium]|nr:capsular biosynthesis protein [Pseudomonadota bacterium]